MPHAPRFIKSVAGQVQGRVVSRRPNALKQVQIELVACYRSRDIGCVLLDAATVRRDHRDGRIWIRAHIDPVVGVFDLYLGEVGVIPVVVTRCVHRDVPALTRGAVRGAQRWLQSPPWPGLPDQRLQTDRCFARPGQADSDP